MINKTLSASLACLLTAIPIAALAEESDRRGWFIGGALGSVKVSANSENVIDWDEDEIDKQFLVGYHFSDWFGLEGTVSSSEEFDTGDNMGDASLQTASFMTKFRLPIGPRAEMYVKTGPTVIFVRLEPNRNSDNYDDASWSETTIGVGAGVSFEVHPHLHLRFAADYAKETLDESNGWLWDDAPSKFLDVEYMRTTLGLYYQF